MAIPAPTREGTIMGSRRLWLALAALCMCNSVLAQDTCGLICPGKEAAQEPAPAEAVDSSIVGTWELNVPTPQGISRWVWEIHQDGTYSFHAEGPGAAPPHSGLFSAAKGRYTLNSTT